MPPHIRHVPADVLIAKAIGSLRGVRAGTPSRIRVLVVPALGEPLMPVASVVHVSRRPQLPPHATLEVALHRADGSRLATFSLDVEVCAVASPVDPVSDAA